MYLPVRIGFCHHIEVDRSKVLYAGPRQCLQCPGSNSAHADDADAGPTQFFGRGRTVEACDTTEAALAIDRQANSVVFQRNFFRGGLLGLDHDPASLSESVAIKEGDNPISLS
jgi:hypothetical protein